MPRSQPTRASSVAQAFKKLVVSAFVVFTFVAYVIHDRLNGSSQATPEPATPAGGGTDSATGDAAQSATPSFITNTPGVVYESSVLPPTSTFVAPTAIDFPTATAQDLPSDTLVPPTLTLVPLPTLVPPSPVPPKATARVAQGYRDGQFTGNIANAYWGVVQVRATIQGGKIARVQFLNYPHDRGTSVRINNYAVPMLQSEAVQAQSAQIDIISGATLTSQAFAQSLQTALNQARG